MWIRRALFLPAGGLAGAGGWPTIKYFNKETGYEGLPYKQKTSEAMCTELGKIENMEAYVMEAGGVVSNMHVSARMPTVLTTPRVQSKCAIADGQGCTDKEKAFIEKTAAAKENVPKQLARLLGMKDGKMNPDLKEWLNQRTAILQQFEKEAATAEL
jgi:hypothetical protein